MTKETKNQRVLKLLLSAGAAPEAGTGEPGLENLVTRLESRITEMEGQMTDLRSQLTHQHDLLEQSSSHDSEVHAMAKLLEKKILKVSKEFPKRHRGLSEQAAHFVNEQLQELAQAVTLDGFKHLLMSILYGGLGTASEVDAFGMDRQFARQVKPFFDFMYYNYWRTTIQGIENLPEQGRGLVVSNHSGTLPYDGCMIRLASENEHPGHRDIRFLVEDFVYHFPFLGTFMYRTGGVRACPENATQLLESDHLVAVFPEGIKGIGKLYKNRYRLQRFGRGGFIRLALRTGAPIIPTAVIGAEEIHPLIYKSTFMAKPLGVPYIPITPTFPILGLLGLIPLPSKWTIIFGKPIYWKQYGPKHADDDLLVNRLSEEVRQRIQSMVFEGLAARRSVWFG